MSGGAKAIRMSAIVVAIASLFALPAYAQGFGKKGGRGRPSVENHPKIDEKAYKAALDRIPTPKQGYDPWGQARQSDPPKTTGKPAQ